MSVSCPQLRFVPHLSLVMAFMQSCYKGSVSSSISAAVHNFIYGILGLSSYIRANINGMVNVFAEYKHVFHERDSG